MKKLNKIAAEVFKRGHIPIVGINAANPVFEHAEIEDRYDAVMKICEALAEKCDAVLLIGESGGACKELEIFERHSRPVYRKVEEIPIESENLKK
ncbi:MAG: hypothetical protein M3209_20900 [Acidobacteriota bacterium]|nr:hypothetical protein [Acidobacteriota bacterium]